MIKKEKVIKIIMFIGALTTYSSYINATNTDPGQKEKSIFTDEQTNQIMQLIQGSIRPLEERIEEQNTIIAEQGREISVLKKYTTYKVIGSSMGASIGSGALTGVVLGVKHGALCGLICGGPLGLVIGGSCGATIGGIGGGALGFLGAKGIIKLKTRNQTGESAAS